ncbi:twin-arginine translocation pathway signal [Sulfitobacter sp. EhC04]|uniref:DUF1501 domain-containing protein n=1 Tax=Sulfitobacter sp. EhC04 TaxID=1849168 RepID=UPI0007F4CC6B|nr:DUF1501 domain-containing protein [Sulfitobacter sp. EhC04]OAN71905.1 twin-arginine translocation pathway signal [Sulfitobacter sp. EhC04]
MTKKLSRRQLLTRATAIGCSLAASPLWTPMTFAQAPWDTRLVVIILRGGMDGLDVVRPMGDPAFAALRPGLKSDGALDLDGYFALHPALAGLMPLWRQQELSFVHAVSTPYRDKRSHFDGQDLLEAGTAELGDGTRDGWLNRLLQQMPGVARDTAYAIGTTPLPVLEGTAPVSNWAPEANLKISPQAMRLAAMVMEEDPALHAALAEAEMLAETEMDGKGGRAHHQIARYAASRLRGDARVAAFSLGGWDTHRVQHRVLPRSLGTLQDSILALKDGLGADVWGKTAILAMTEFGRTARENGAGGTDHGTGGLAILAGGAIKGGRVSTRWPGLAEVDLYERRDLMPTGDVRATAAWMLRGITGVNKDTLEASVFPGLDMGSDPGLLG